MDDVDVFFSNELLLQMEAALLMKMIDAGIANKEEAEKAKMIFRAFTKRGVPVKTILEAIQEITESGV